MSMRVARLHGAGDLRLHDEPEPGPPPTGWSTVRVTSVGLCGSDLHWFTEGGIGEVQVGDPVVPGHELAGVALDGPHAGRRVAVDPAIPCGRCTECRAGHGNLCPSVRFAGHGDLDGALQERLLWPEHLLFPLPDAIDDAGGALLEPLGVAIHAVDLAHVRLGADVLVVGAGPIGVLVAQVARAAGAGRVLVSEPLAHRREAALAAGADAVWEPGSTVDVVVEAAGTDAAVATAVDAARPGARIVLAGIPSTEHTAFPASPARRKGLTFVMSRRMHETYPRAIALVERGLVDLAPLVTARYPLGDAVAAFEHAAARSGQKTIVDVGRAEISHTHQTARATVDGRKVIEG